MRRANPGTEFVLGNDGRVYEQPITADRATQLSHQLGGMLGQHPQDKGASVEDHPRFAAYNKVPTWYTISIELGGEAGNNNAGSVILRPEAFAAKRLTWATSGDVFPFIAAADTGTPGGGSIQGRSVIMNWQDEYTRFLGQQDSLVSCLLGDSQGYLDFPRGILFQGKQSITVSLTRLFWPSSSDPATTRWDFSLQGLMLLPPGVDSSGGPGS